MVLLNLYFDIKVYIVYTIHFISHCMCMYCTCVPAWSFILCNFSMCVDDFAGFDTKMSNFERFICFICMSISTSAFFETFMKRNNYIYTFLL